MNHSNSVSVDTLRLYVPGVNYQITDNPLLEVLDGAKCYLWKDSAGKVVRGACASWQGDDIIVRLKGVAGNPYTPPPCTIYFSVPKCSYGNNAAPVDRDQLQGVLDGVQETLAEIGITFDIMSAIISRIDIFRDIELSREVAEYVPVLSSLFIPYLKKTDFQKTGVLFFNKSRTMTFYDKVAEICKNGLKRMRNMPIGNILRSEFRLMNAKAVRDNLNPLLGRKRGTAIVVQTLVDNYDLIMGYHRKVSDLLFKMELPAQEDALTAYYADGKEISPEKLQTMQAETLVKRFGTSAKKRFTELLEIEKGLETFFCPDKRLKIIEDRIKRDYPTHKSQGTRTRQAEWELLQMALLPSGMPYSSLYQELRTKLCGAQLSEVEREVLKREPLSLPSDDAVETNEQMPKVA